VLHEPYAGYGHGEDEHASDEKQRGHLEWRRRAA
jgi:hypothetical protein